MNQEKIMKPKLKRRSSGKKENTLTICKTSKAVEFYLYAPQARQVTVAGSFNDWCVTDTVLKKGLNGIWRGWVALEPGGYQYRFVVDGYWVDDSKAQETVPNGMGSRNAVLDVK